MTISSTFSSRRRITSSRSTGTTMLLLTITTMMMMMIMPFPSLFVSGGTSDHRYQPKEHVELWVNKVGPYANPQEAYEYYTLPYCAPDTKHHPDAPADADSRKYNTWKLQSLGESLGGHALRHSGHDIVFDTSSTMEKVESCTTKPLTEQQSNAFRNAIQHRWFYQMYLDDLPVWGMVGELVSDPNKKGNDITEQNDYDRLNHVTDVADLGNLLPHVYTERNLVIQYNGNQIVQVDLTSEKTSLVEVKEGITLEFKLNISFQETEEQFHSRFDRYLDHEFFKHPIHWFSIFNSFMMVLFLMGLVALILLRTLRKDYARYGMVQQQAQPQYDEEGQPIDEDDGGKPLLDSKGHGGGAGPAGPNDDSGWKQVHGDVFRAPSGLVLFAALLGTGWQLVVLTVAVIIFAVLGPLHGEVHEERGEVLTSIIVCYALSSIVAGYFSGQYFKLYYPTTPAGRRGAAAGSGSAQQPKTTLWQLVMGLTVLLLPTVTTIILSVLNTVSLIYGTINTIPFFGIVKLFLIWVFVSVPLCVLGTMLGRHSIGGGTGGGGKPGAPTTTDHFPCRVNAIPRPIPEDVPWYGKPIGLIPLAGLLSFGSIFIEFYYILTSLWNYKFYHVYGFLLGVYTILTIVVGMTSIIVVYFCLNAENYHWQWTSFVSGASTAAYVFLYSVYYFLFKTAMHGFLQTIFYFGYMSIISLNLALLCGTLGHGAAAFFVRAIFQNVKVD